MVLCYVRLIYDGACYTAQLTPRKCMCVYGWDIIRMRDEEEEWSSRVLASSGAAERYLERRPVRHGGEWMAVEGLRWVKERAEKLPTGTSQHPYYPRPRIETRELGARARKKERDKERDEAGSAEGQCKVWASAVSRHIFFRLKQFFCSFLAIHPDSLVSRPTRKSAPRPLILPAETDISGTSRSRDNCLRFSPFPPLSRPFP